jgi:sugar lactone lactonase YvrE
MDEKIENPHKLPEAISYLGDVADQSLRSALENSKSGIFTGLSIAAVDKKNLIHSDDGLSPAGGIVEDGHGRLYLSDEFNHRICVYDEDGNLKESFGQKGSENGMLHYPRGLALDGDGNLYVADAWNHSISVFGPDLSFKSKIGSLGTGNGELDEPVGIVIIGDRLYVLEKSNHRIQAFTLSGEHIGFIGKRGSVSEQEQFYLNWTSPKIFSPPVFEFPSAIAADNKGNIYIADTNNHRVVKLDSSTYNPESEYNLSGIRYPSGLACDREGNLHVTRFNNETVSVFSPKGFRLYSYKAGLEVPLAIAISGESLYISDGNKPGLASFGLKATHQTGFAAEERFGYHTKSALYSLKTGNWDEGARHLADASAYDPPDPIALGNILPDNSYAFAKQKEKIDRSLLDAAKPFAGLLRKVSINLFGEILKSLEEKTDAIDGITSVSLEIEKSFLLGGASPSNDDLQVERHRATKKLYNKTAEIKKMLAAYKKIEEFHRRLGCIGVSSEERLDALGENFNTLLDLRQKKEAWFEEANREAPSLSFTSLPDQRALFQQNQNRLLYLAADFDILCSIAAEQNRELAALLKKSLVKNEEKLFETVCASLDLLALFPDSFTQHIDYFKSIEMLFEALGEKRSGEIALRAGNEKHWDSLTREENIPAEKDSPYRLIAALYSGGGLKPQKEARGVSWGKVSDFYIGEFRKFLQEFEPLARELQQQLQQLPAAHKTDPKQASEIDKKFGLLWFHSYFQERYITVMMREYLVRFALFCADSSNMDSAEAKATLEILEKLATETASNIHDLSERSAVQGMRLKDDLNLQEKNRARIEIVILMSSYNFNITLGKYLQPALISLKNKFGPDGEPVKPSGVFRGLYEPSTQFHSPAVITIDDRGNIYVLSISTGYIYVTNENGEPIGRFGGYGRMPGKTSFPYDMAITPDNELLVSDRFGNSFSIYSLDGRFLRLLPMQFPDGKNSYRIQIDSIGNIFASHLDGKGISVFDRNGTLIKSIPAEGLEIKGFSIGNDKIFAGGGGKFYLLDTNGTVIKKIQMKETGFKTITSTDICEDGTFYAVDLSNRLIKIDSGFTEAKLVKGIQTQNMVAVATRGNLLAISDYFGEAIMFFKNI